jgi:hypothetical protein
MALKVEQSAAYEANRAIATIGVPKLFDDVASLLADSSTDYFPQATVPPSQVTKPVVVEGSFIQTRAEGFVYRVAADDATDHDLETAGGIKLYVLPNSSNAIAVEAFGVASGGTQTDSAFVTTNTTRMQKAWAYSGAKGVELVFAAESASTPYFVSHLNLVSGLKLRGGPRSTYIQLPTSNYTGTNADAALQFFIRRPDDNVRYLGGVVTNITFCTATSSVSNAQDNNRNLAGVAHAGLEAWNWENVNFFGFGQGGLIIARAESGNEGMGFSATTQDGNYNTFKRITCNSCGRYRADEQSRGGVVLLYKANSNNFFGIFSRGNTDSSSVAMVYGTNNVFVHGTGESCQYAVRSGRNAAYNIYQGFRGEGVTATHKCYEWEGTSDANGPLAFNWIIGPHLSTGTTDVEFDTGHNCWVQGAAGRDPFRARRKRGVSALTRADGLIDVRGVRVRPGEPFEIMATLEDGRTYNDATCIPYYRFISGILGASSGQVLGGIEFENSDTSGGAAGVSASILAVFEGSSGQTAIVLSTGTGTTLTERLRIGSSGIISIASGSVIEGDEATFDELNAIDLSTNTLTTNTLDVPGFETGVVSLERLQYLPLSADPPNPAEGAAIAWASDGTGLGNAGDIMVKIRSSNVTQYGTLFAYADTVAIPGYQYDDLIDDADLVSRLDGNGMLFNLVDTQGNYDGTITGIPQYLPPVPQAYTTSKAIGFNGATHITQDGAAIPGTGDLTIAGWAKTDSLAASNQRLFSMASDASTGFSVLIPTNSSALWVSVLGDEVYESDDGAIAAGQWFHWAVTITTTGTIKIYINGAQSGATNTDATVSYGGFIRWGRDRTATAYFIGEMCEMLIYDRILTDAEVASLAEGA